MGIALHHFAARPQSVNARLFCRICPSLSCLFSCKYKLPILQILCFDNDANCRGVGGCCAHGSESIT